MCDVQAMATPVDDVIVLAGEHTAGGNSGTTFGAASSGKRAALQIFEDIVRQMIFY